LGSHGTRPSFAHSNIYIVHFSPFVKPFKHLATTLTVDLALRQQSSGQETDEKRRR